MKTLHGRSVKLLQERCQAWFQGEDLLWLGRFSPLMASKSTRCTNIVLLGDAISALAKSKLPVSGRFRIWTLCHAQREALIKIFGYKKQEIGVIPRNELFAVRQTQSKPKLSSSYEMVFGGRLSKAKNIDLLVLSCWWLQHEFGHKVRLVLRGRWDNESHLGYSTRNYRKEIESLIRSRQWKIAPKILPVAPAHIWLKKKKYTLVCSLSNSYMEDFGVAIAQAQELGLPILVSDWGGHRDIVDCDSVLKVPATWLGDPEDSASARLARAYCIAKEMDSWIRQKGKQQKNKRINQTQVHLKQKPREISARQILALQTRYKRKYKFAHNFESGLALGVMQCHQILSQIETAFLAKTPRILAIMKTEKYFWTSWKQIIPGIEFSWTKMACERGLQAKYYRPNNVFARWKIENKIEQLVIPASFGEQLPFILKLWSWHRPKSPVFLHEHGELPGLGVLWGSNWTYFPTKLTLIVASERYRRLGKTLYPRGSFAVMPFFSLPALLSRIENPALKLNSTAYFYSGREESAKGLELASLAADKSPFFMFLYKSKFREYELPHKRRRKLIRQQKNIHYSNKLPYEQYLHFLRSRRLCFIGLSTHWNENFGIAAWTALAFGHQAILSDWGGHQQLKKMFPLQVTLVPVEKTQQGFIVSKTTFLHTLHRHKFLHFPEKCTSDLVRRPTRHSMALSSHWQLAKRFYARWSEFQSKHNHKIDLLLETRKIYQGKHHVFASHQDLLAQEIGGILSKLD